MTDRTMTAMYDTRGAAETARDRLIGVGVPTAAISVHAAEGSDTVLADHKEKGFWAGLADLFVPDEDRHTYAEGLSRGGYLLSARVPDGFEDEASSILEGSSPVDLEERSRTWREGGWRGFEAEPAIGSSATVAYGEGADRDDLAIPPASGTMTAGSARQEFGERSDHGSGRGDLTTDRSQDVVHAAEEELRVGKREVGRGTVRVRSYVTERPVEEQVNLQQERVSIERRPVNRELAAGETPFQERTIEAVERGEEAVVSKSARVTEEIGLRKDVEHETQTVRDTVRKQEVEVIDEREADTLAASGTTTAVEDSASSDRAAQKRGRPGV